MVRAQRTGRRELGMPRRKRVRDGVQRQRATGLLLALLPACMLLGPMLPNAVTVEPVESEPARARISVAPLRVSKPPLGAPIDLTAASVARLADLDALMLASRARPLGHASPPPPLKLQEENEEEEATIVLDDESEGASAEYFDSVEEPMLVVDTRPLWDPAVFDVIPGLIDRNGWSEFDDFVGTGVFAPSGNPPPPAVPEPGTALLVATGLALLAIRSRRA